MSKLAELLNQKSTAANSANPANPEPEISKISNFSRGTYPKTHSLTDDELRDVADTDWPEIQNDPAQLDALRAAAETAAQIRQGVVPLHYTSTTTCRRCGPVWTFPGVPPKVECCTWCLARAAGVAVPQPVAESFLNGQCSGTTRENATRPGGRHSSNSGHKKITAGD